MFDNDLRTITVDVDILNYYIGNVHNCRHTRYCDLEAYMEMAKINAFYTTMRNLASRWHWSEKKVHRFLKTLCEFNMIKMEKSNGFRGQYFIRIIEPGASHE